MANIGDQLTSPESGWRRYDNNSDGIAYNGTWSTWSNSSHYRGSTVYSNSVNSKIFFKFKGTKLRIISPMYSSSQKYSTSVVIKIDDEIEYFSVRSSTDANFQRLVYEKIGLNYDIHQVEIYTNIEGQFFHLDAIDIDDIGYIIASVGSRLTSPEPGWKRYDNKNSAFQYVGSGWYSLSDVPSQYYQGEGMFSAVRGDKVRFDFIGSNIRFVMQRYSNRHDSIPVYIDDLLVNTYSDYATSALPSVLVFEYTGLMWGRHKVEIIVPNDASVNKLILWDAVDIDENGRLLHSDEVLDISDLEVGKRIRCHYNASSNQFGAFSRLGQETSDFIPATSTATPDGDFYLIMVEDWNGIKRLIADRNIQHSISWDTLNTVGVASGSGLQLKYNIQERLEALYHFEESGSILIDSLSRRNGNITGTTIVTGYNGGNARSFSGTDKITFNSPVIPLGKKSIRFKIKKSTIPTAAEYIIWNAISFAEKGTNVAVQTNGSIVFLLYNGTTESFRVTGTKNICDGQWHDILLTWDGTVNTDGVKMYIDDMTTPHVTGTSSAIETSASTRNLSISGHTETARMFNGILDELEIYNDVIDPINTKPISNNYLYTIRLLTGGIFSTDTDNEWSKYIVNSTLNGTITAGDNAVWNWNGIASWTSTTPTNSASNRMCRGNAGAGSYYTDRASSIANSVNGFRPVLIIEDLSIFGDLTSSININSDYKKLENGFYGYDKLSNLYVLYNNSLISNINIRSHGRMTGKVEISPVYTLNLDSQIDVKQVSQLFSTLSVNPKGQMTGIVDVIPPPRITVETATIQDAFVRSSVPRLNYGTTQKILFGYSQDLNDIYRSFIKFDLNHIPEKMRITKAILKLYFDYDSQPELQIQIKELLEDWTELGITWANQPVATNTVASLTVGSTKGYIEIDILDVVNRWYNGDTENNGLMIRSTDESIPLYYSFCSREHSQFKPKLEIEYFDPFPKSVDLSVRQASLTVRSNRWKDLSSKLNVRTTWDYKELVSSMHIYNFNYMIESSITVIRKNVYSTMKVRRSDKSNLPSSFSIKKTGFPIDLSSKLFVNNPDIYCNIIVRRSDKSLLSGSVIARRTEWSKLNSSISQIRTKIHCSISVVFSSSIDGSITVRQKRWGNLPSHIIAIKHREKDLDGNISVFKNEDFHGHIFVRSGYLKSSIMIPYRETFDLKTRLNVQVFYISDLESVLIVQEDPYNTAYAFIL